MFNDRSRGTSRSVIPEPDLDRVLAAAQAAAAHDFIMRLPLGYETKIGESGLVSLRRPEAAHCDCAGHLQQPAGV